MQRELTFDTTKGPVRFKQIWSAMAYVNPNTGESKNADILRRERDIGRKLRNMSETKEIHDEGFPTTSKQRVMKEGEHKVIFEQSEIEHIRMKIEKYPAWNPMADDHVADLYDWLGTGIEPSSNGNNSNKENK